MLTWNEEQKRFEYIPIGISNLQTFSTVFFNTYENLKATHFKEDVVNSIYYTYDKTHVIWFCILEAMSTGKITKEATMELIRQILGITTEKEISKPKIGRNIIIRK